jgi:hypothetical protein
VEKGGVQMALPLKEQEVEEVLVTRKGGQVITMPKQTSTAAEEENDDSVTKKHEVREILPQTFG